MIIDHKIGMHWLLTGLAVSVFCLAGLQALLLHVQDKQLRSKHIVGIMKTLPPLETMEIFLFRIVGCGLLLLTIVMITSLYFFSHEILTGYLLSKIVIVALAWIFFAILLAGRYWFGLRGKRAVYGTLGGVVLLIAVYVLSLGPVYNSTWLAKKCCFSAVRCSHITIYAALRFSPINTFCLSLANCKQTLLPRELIL